MAILGELNVTAWDEWVATRPELVQEMCRRLPPNRLYRMKGKDDEDKGSGFTGHRVTLLSYSEDGTVSVAVGDKYNSVMFCRNVFGVDPDDLEECPLPGPEEVVGAVLTEEEDIKDYIAALKERRAKSEEDK